MHAQLHGTEYHAYDSYRSDGSAQVVVSVATYSQVKLAVPQPDQLESWVQTFRQLLQDPAVLNSLRAGGFHKRVEQFKELLVGKLAKHGRVTSKVVQDGLAVRLTLRGVGHLEYWWTHGANSLYVHKGERSVEYRLDPLRDDLEAKAEEVVRALVS